jgi:hypothetical protein
MRALSAFLPSPRSLSPLAISPPGKSQSLNPSPYQYSVPLGHTYYQKQRSPSSRAHSCFSCRFSIGKRNFYNAISSNFASGLHKIRTAQPIPAHTSFIDRIDLTLQEPRDQIEEGERINAFWAVFFMDRCLSVMFGPPLVISDMDAPGMQIDTPWPLEMETYERVGAFSISVLVETR